MTPRSPVRRPLRRAGDVIRWLPGKKGRGGVIPHRQEVIALLIVEAILAGVEDSASIIQHVVADHILGADDEDVIGVARRIAEAFADVGIPTTPRTPVLEPSPSSVSQMESGP